MSRVYYQLYLQDVLSLTRTLVIKCGDVAETINRELQYIGHEVDRDRPDTWKYYMNLAGEYHPADQMMTVRSMDTLEEIEFTLENLEFHRATAREYAPGSRYYNDLVRRYPNQVPLINGVLYPVDKQVALDTSDGTLLYYDKTYIESNESNLVPELQSWLYSFFSRWYNAQYNIPDDMYLPAYLGTLYLQIPHVIQLIRLRNVKTPQAHSFHIREYLASNGRLDEYIPYLTKEQQLYLYRNIRFINRNVGKQSTFNRLVQQLLTKRGLPLATYRLEHDASNLPEGIKPEVELSKHPINFGYNQTGLDSTTVHTILQRQASIARDNPIVQAETESRVIDQFSSAAFSDLPTKVLESEVVDRTDSSVRALETVLLNEWVYLASNGRYRAFVNVPNPRTGENMTMSVKDAFIVALYAFSKARDIHLTTIPRVIAYDVLRESLPSFAELESIVDRRYVRKGLIQAVMDRISPLGEYIATERFHNACSNLHQEYLKLWELYSFQEHYMTRGMMEHVVQRHFQHIKCELVNETTSFERWLTLSGYDIADLPPVDMEQLFQDCVEVATGANLTSSLTLGEVQRAMLGLMGKLSSYSVQYLRTINDGAFRYIGTPAIRVGDVGYASKAKYFIAGPGMTALSIRNRSRSEFALQSEFVLPDMEVRARTQTPLKIDPTVAYRPRPEAIAHIQLNVSNVGVRGFSFVVDNPTPPDSDLGHYQ